MKFKILIPVYNDWQSVSKLLDEIDELSISSEFQVSVVIVNDASNHDRLDEKKVLDNIETIKILNMKSIFLRGKMFIIKNLVMEKSSN